MSTHTCGTIGSSFYTHIIRGKFITSSTPRRRFGLLSRFYFLCIRDKKDVIFTSLSRRRIRTHKPSYTK